MSKMEKTTEIKKTATTTAIDLDKILAKARNSFSKSEKGLAAQITSGANIPRATKDSDFVMYPGEHWQQLTGIRGIPFGKFVQISGKPNSGKSSHAYAFMKEAQDKGTIVILWDSENKFSPTRFDNYFGGRSNELILCTSKVILAGGDMVIAAARAAAEAYPDRKILIVWDSIGGSISTAEDVKALRESRQMAISAKENSMICHAWNNLSEELKNKQTNEERVAVLLINQTYANIGSVGQKEGGGAKIEYFSSLIIQLTRKSDVFKQKDGQKMKTGIISRARVVKNHMFDGDSCVAEIDLEITASGITFAAKKDKDDWAEEDAEE